MPTSPGHHYLFTLFTPAVPQRRLAGVQLEEEEEEKHGVVE